MTVDELKAARSAAQTAQDRMRRCRDVIEEIDRDIVRLRSEYQEAVADLGRAQAAAALGASADVNEPRRLADQLRARLDELPAKRTALEAMRPDLARAAQSAMNAYDAARARFGAPMQAALEERARGAWAAALDAHRAYLIAARYVGRPTTGAFARFGAPAAADSIDGMAAARDLTASFELATGARMMTDDEAIAWLSEVAQ